MQIVHADRVISLTPGATPDYNHANPIVKLMSLVEGVRLAAERDAYHHDQLQLLFPFDRLDFHPPSGGDAGILDPTQQDNKTDFQKQNVRDFVATDTHLVRGWAGAGDWTGPFLRLSYRAGPDTHLSVAAGHSLGPSIQLWIKVGSRTTQGLITVPYNAESGRYEVELWGFPGSDLRSRLDEQGQAAVDRGELTARPDLVVGGLGDFDLGGLLQSNVSVDDVAPEHAMHPLRPLHVELAWADSSGTIWDSNLGSNYHYEFNMRVRGWDQFLRVGTSPSPHGGVGQLEYRNLLSNYGQYKAGAAAPQLSRQLESWNLDAFGRKGGTGLEPFLAVEYMDLHLLQPGCAIGLHRHRDNQEAFLLLDGHAYMVVGDWCKMPERERCFEVRTLRPGHLAMLRGGNLHGLVNSTDEKISLFMFGGYD